MTAPIKSPPARLTQWERARLWALLLAVLPTMGLGCTLASLGGYAALAELFGNGADVVFPWWPVIPGVILFWGGGALGQYAANRLDI